MPILDKKFTPERCLIRYKVDEDQHGMRLDQFLQCYLSTFSRENVKKKIQDGEIQIKNRPGKMRPNSRVHYNDIVSMSIVKTEHEDEFWEGKKISLEKIQDIIFEDDHLIVISKPPFMSTHPTGRHLFYCATVHFEEIYHKTIHSIHRLDRETSGILLLGKDSKTSNQVSTSFEKGLVKKCYFFISKSSYSGLLNFCEESRLDNPDEGRKRVLIQSYPKESDQGKEAKTFFKILFQEKNYTLGLAFPHTGRQHQIRVHALINNLPLLGDKLYLGGYPVFQRFKDFVSTKEDYKFLEIPRHALHAYAIKIPYQNQERIFKSKIPNDLSSWIQKNLSISINDIEKKIESELKNL